jgi:hypothetical protein
MKIRRAPISFVDRDGLMWYGFGQYASANITDSPRMLSDMWTLNFTSQSWTFVGGPLVFDSLGNMTSSLHETLPTTWPASMYRSSACYDAQTHVAYVFGGEYVNVTSFPQFSGRMWRFNLTDLTWTWIGGSPNDSFTASPAQNGQGGPNVMPRPRAGTTLICERVSEPGGQLALWFFSGSGLTGTWAFNFTDFGFYLWSSANLTDFRPPAGEDFAMWRDGDELFAFSLTTDELRVWIWNLRRKIWTSVSPYVSINGSLPLVGPTGVATDFSWPIPRQQSSVASNGMSFCPKSASHVLNLVMFLLRICCVYIWRL